MANFIKVMRWKDGECFGAGCESALVNIKKIEAVLVDGSSTTIFYRGSPYNSIEGVQESPDEIHALIQETAKEKCKMRHRIDELEQENNGLREGNEDLRMRVRARGG